MMLGGGRDGGRDGGRGGDSEVQQGWESRIFLSGVSCSIKEPGAFILFLKAT